MFRTATVGVLLGTAILASACVTTRQPTEQMTQVSVRYDPYNYNVAEIREQAKAECRAKGGSHVVEASNTPNLESPRWAYMTFDCFQ